MNKSLKRLTNVGVLTALAVVLMLFSFPYPYAPFLQYEFGDVPLLIIGFLYGPVYGLVSTIIGSIAMAVLTGKGGPYGVIMHVIATGTLVVIASYMYNKWHTKKGAYYGLIAGSFAMTAIMIPSNLLITPIYTGFTVSKVATYIPAFLVFNITKSLGNSTVTVLLYKKLANFLRSKGLIKNEKEIIDS